MDAPTPLDTLAAALTAVDRAVESCLALAWSPEPTGDERRHTARRLVDAYERADRRADLLLGAMIAEHTIPSLSALLDVTEAACRRASDRTAAAYALQAGLPLADRAGLAAAGRALILAEHAEGRAAARDLLVRSAVALPWARRRAGRRKGAA